MRRISLLAFVLLAAAYAACGGTPSKPHPPDPDAGSGTTGAVDAGPCQDDLDCRSGEHCIQGRCGSCRVAPILACPSGYSCAHNGACIPPEGSSGSTGGSSGSTGATGLPCVHRSDCPGSEACLPDADGGVCGVPPDGQSCTSNDGCLKAFICQAEACVLGCYSNLDCHGTQQPVCAAGNPGHCAACTSSSQCFTGEACIAGQCVPQQACQTPADCAGLGCIDGYCGPCTANAECGQGQYCERSSGHCRNLATTCVSDVQCQDENEGAGWYCGFSGGSQQCLLGCTPDSLCAIPQIGCCNLAAGASCSPTTHACVQPSGTSSGSTSGGSDSGSSTGSSDSGTGSSGSGSASTGSSGSGSGSTGASASSSSGSGGTGGGSTTGGASSSGSTGSSGTTGSTASTTVWYAEGPLAGATDDKAVYYLDVPSGATFLSVRMFGGAAASGDADLYVRFGSAPTTINYDCGPYLSGSNETCTFALPQAGRYYVMVNGFSAYSDVYLQVGVYSAPVGAGSPLQRDVPVGPLSGASSSNTRFTVDVPSGVSNLLVFLGEASGATGDSDLYVRLGAPADSTHFDWSSTNGGSSEAIVIPVTQPGTYDLSVYGYSSYTRAYLVTSFQ